MHAICRVEIQNIAHGCHINFITGYLQLSNNYALTKTYFKTLSVLRFDKEIIFTYRDCLIILRIVICKYKDLVVVWEFSFKETLFQPKNRIM